MRDAHSVSQVPWQVSRQEFIEAARQHARDAACCVFVIDDSIPATARGGYAALVIAYARAGEPVHIFDDGAAAVLVTEGGVQSGRVVAERVLGQMRRLSLDQTLRAGISPVGGDAEAALSRARTAAETAEAGAAQAAD